jgi:hypothetical protein
MASRSSWRFAACCGLSAPLSRKCFFQRRMRQFGHVVEAGAHVELAAFPVEQGDVERHAEGVDRAALRIGQVHLQAGAFERVPQLLLHPLRAQGVEDQGLWPGWRAFSQATTRSSAAAASTCSQAQS